MTREELEQNPFFVLGVAPTSSRMDIERAAQKLLAQLAIGAASAQVYSTPFGTRSRDEALVRSALTTLRDPERRVLLELWAEAKPAPSWAAPEPFDEAPASIGWRGPWAE
jgi:hypothetical protein